MLIQFLSNVSRFIRAMPTLQESYKRAIAAYPKPDRPPSPPAASTTPQTPTAAQTLPPRGQEHRYWYYQLKASDAIFPKTNKENEYSRFQPEDNIKIISYD
ncbi:MAG: hypothetical protein AB4426_02990 [Xenococcaceae cyanobacterium]